MLLNRIGTKILLGVTFPLLLIIVLGFVLYKSINTIIYSHDWVTHTHGVIAEATLIEKLLVDMETGQRGYLISGKDNFLEPYDAAVEKLNYVIIGLKETVSDNPPQVTRLHELSKILKDWHRFAGNPEINMRSRINEGKEDYSELVRMVEAETGKTLMDKMRNILTEFKSVELRLMTEREQSSLSSIEKTVTYIVAGTVIVVILSILISVFITAGITGSVRQAVVAAETIADGTLDAEFKLSGSDEMNKLGESLDRMRRKIFEDREKLELINKYKTEFLANMSHELRTPLNSLLLVANVLTRNKEGNLTDKQVESIEMIHRVGAQLLGLINDILDLSKIEAGMLDVVSEHFDLDDLFSNIDAQFRPIAEEKKLNFRMECNTDEIKFIKSDQQRVEQILKNFLSNAFKFTEKGSVILRVKRAVKDMHSKNGIIPHMNVVKFSVIDTGIGISEDGKSDIFEEFQQADGSISRKYGGTGLGLSISRELIELLGGEISYDSTLGKGSTFTMTIPQVMPEM